RVSIPSAQCWIAARPDRTSGVGSFFELVFCALARFFEKNSTAEKIRWYTRCRKNKKRPRREIGGPVFPTLKNLNFERYRQRETPISQPGVIRQAFNIKSMQECMSSEQQDHQSGPSHFFASISAEISTDSTDRWPAHRVKVITRFF
ncbi:unnamed protein product, partial [Nesidiocoris tenuis]